MDWNNHQYTGWYSPSKASINHHLSIIANYIQLYQLHIYIYIIILYIYISICSWLDPHQNPVTLW